MVQVICLPSIWGLQGQPTPTIRHVNIWDDFDSLSFLSILIHHWKYFRPFVFYRVASARFNCHLRQLIESSQYLTLLIVDSFHVFFPQYKLLFFSSFRGRRVEQRPEQCSNLSFSYRSKLRVFRLVAVRRVWMCKFGASFSYAFDFRSQFVNRQADEQRYIDGLVGDFGIYVFSACAHFQCGSEHGKRSLLLSFLFCIIFLFYCYFSSRIFLPAGRYILHSSSLTLQRLLPAKTHW